MTEILVATVLAVALAVAFFSLFRKKPANDAKTEPRPEPTKTCPLCGERLKPGEKVHSVVFATKTQDKIMEISGCPHCKPETAKTGVQRLCPVCKKPLRPQDVVTARVFDRKDGRKTHIHILGCPRCRERG